MSSKSKWYHPKRESGWSKNLSEKQRRNIVYRNTADKNKSAYERNLLAESQLLALANVNKGKKGDKDTRDKALKDAEFFKRRREKLKREGKRKYFRKHRKEYV